MATAKCDGKLRGLSWNWFRNGGQNTSKIRTHIKAKFSSFLLKFHQSGQKMEKKINHTAISGKFYWTKVSHQCKAKYKKNLI